jgi:hypothetical protein
MTEPEQFEIQWIDLEREPKDRPDPNFPDGIDLDIAKGRWPQCRVALPYPAPRCGMYLIDCKKCGTNILVTTAGRPDDPRSVTLPCDLAKKPVQ